MPKRGKQSVPGAWTPPDERESIDRPSVDRAAADSPPRTPPARTVRGKGSTAGGPRMAGGGSNGEAREEIGDSAATRARSDSHDLSWSPQRQRRSVLENMLLSLDHAAGMEPLTRGLGPTSRAAAAGTVGGAGDDAMHEANTFAFSTPPRHRDRSNTGQSSISSSIFSPALEVQPDTHNKTRGHRSNSSLNYQTGLSRIDSVRRGQGWMEPDTVQEHETLIVSEAPQSATAAMPPRRTSHGGSPSSSVDLGNDGRWQSNPKRRSRSFDHGLMRSEQFVTFDRRPLMFASAEDQATASAIYDSLEAAPMPTIPGGPRRQGESVPPSPAIESDDGSTSGRRGSLRSPMAGIFTRSERSQSPKRGEGRTERVERPSNLRHGHSYDERLGRRSDDLPDQSRPYPSGSAATTPGSTQRQGFFRRVFGSSKSPAGPGDAGTPIPTQRAMSESAPSGSGRLDPARIESVSDASQQTPGPTNEARKAKKAEKESPTLTKKSSFFRRRKKSFAQPTPVPDLPPQLHPDLPANRTPQQTARDQATTPSSLLRALDPYLAQDHASEAEPQANRTSYEEPRQERGTYDSMGRATIRPVDEGTLAVSNSPRYQNAGRKGSIGADVPSQSPKQRKRRSKDLTIASSVPQHARNASEIEKALPLTPPASSTVYIQSSPATSPRSTTGKGKRKSVDVAKNPGPASAPPGHDPEGAGPGASVKSPRSAGGDRKQQQRVLTLADMQAPSNPPPPPPTSPNVIETLMAPFPRQSPDDGSVYNTASSASSLPEGRSIARAAQDSSNEEAIDDSDAAPVAEFPSEDDRKQAKSLFKGTHGIDRGEAGAWLGEEGPDRARVREAYMQLFDWANMSILGAMRSFCSQTRLKGETQQVDRLLDALSARWCECNPNHGFKAADVVHTICYSILLLNTDLHVANIDQKMTRNQFIKNTMPTIRRVVADAAPDAFKDTAQLMPPPARPPPAVPSDSPSLDPTKSQDMRRPSLVNRPSYQSDSDMVNSGPATPVDGPAPAEDCGPLVAAPFSGRQGMWEGQVETVLKNFYASIREDRLHLFGSDAPHPARSQPSVTSLTAGTGGPLRRSNSMVSKAGSETVALRGRLLDGRLGSRWSSKNRSRPRLYPPSSSYGQSSRTSVDDDTASAISPSATSLWSKVSLGRTQASMSVNSFSVLPSTEFHQSIGFANALSQAIIREEAVGDGDESLRARPLMEDESLELAGAPWAKEGIVKHKHHLETVDKKAKDRSWVECFAVIDKGWMRLFQFNVNARTLRQKSRGKPVSGGVVGGGNWTENAEPLGSYLLRQSIATALPPPGYSKTRPHVWALSLPSGAVHLFQVGTPEIVKEFVSTVNYWSARMSKEPLVGGVSNIEYGWSDAVINMALLQDRDNPSRASANGGPRSSVQSSVRGSIDQSNAVRPRLPADRIHISDWTPPMQSTMPSQLMEVDQLRALSAYVSNIEQELKKHNNLHRGMHLAYTPRTPNCTKAMSNWERKSSYLLQEIVKFSTYIESLRAAQTQKERIYAERNEREQERERAAVEDALAQDEEDEAAPAPVELA